ncbi:thioredoxin family protein [Siphonobacter sp. SORGH_AS_0500]|uniref:thioredoxin family protein n=1 Tax=Siphonobacter sp. SORGH_AS_0500 TaxID=1864824 RepID=UPI002855FDB6|nr:thioredoxin family protein [Siphonobacter sp. SORGH_AS_0500]MDR6195135.1 thiol-disulfide isomerase/thioredoxin [Siphonobacter sp. SORGH_AS_0500]
MRKLSWVLAFLITSTYAFGQGVNFIPGNLRTPFTQAKTKGKLVFLEVYSPTCHICESFIPTFKNASVGKAFNDRFVSYKLDVNTPEAQAFLAKQNLFVPSLPLFLFFDSNVKLIHAQSTENAVQPLVALASKVADSKQRAQNYQNRFRQGERNPSFLADYGYFSRIMKDTVSNIQAMQAYTKALKPAEYTSKAAFTVIQKVLLDAENPLFDYFMNHLALYKSKFPAEDLKKIGEYIVMTTLYSSRAATMSPARIQKLGSYLNTLGFDRKSIENRTLIPELNALIKTQQWAQVIDRVNQYEKLGSPGPDEFTYLGNYLKGKSQNPQVVQKATMLLSRGRR